jgi:hypothetical protein
VELPPSAARMYQAWWSFAQYAASAREADGSYSFNVADVQTAASQINRDVYGGQGGYNPPGLSVLFGKARAIANAEFAFDDHPPDLPSGQFPVAEAPWSRSTAEQAAMPQWQARMKFTYSDEAGNVQQEMTTVIINQVLPSTMASLQAQMELRIQDQLNSAPGQGTPRSGQLISIDSVTLLAV